MYTKNAAFFWNEHLPNPAKNEQKNDFIQIFLSESLVLCKWKSDSLEKMSDSLWLLFCHEQLEHFAHSCSFLVSDLSELLMVAHFWWATCAIHSQLLFYHERSEQIAHSCSLKWVILSKRANSQPWWFP